MIIFQIYFVKEFKTKSMIQEASFHPVNLLGKCHTFADQIPTSADCNLGSVRKQKTPMLNTEVLFT